MGVRKLTTYARYRNTLWTYTQLQDTVIAVDGLALVWFLYESRVDCRYGGEYDQFAQIIRRFFNSLISQGVAPYVLIDGPVLCPTSRQDEEILRSHKLSLDDCDAFVLPLMAKLVFVQELRNLGIRFVVCDGEADQELAALANHWNCPIMSNDSDFFIYDLPAGYIPFSSLDLTSRPITAKLYKRPRLARLLRIPEDFLPLFASLMGNDYVGEETLAPFKKVLFRSEDLTLIRTSTLIMTIASFISRYQSPSEALQSAADLADLYVCNHSEETSACASEDQDNEETDLSSSSESEEDDLKSHLELSMSQYKISDNSFRGYFEQNETRTRRETRHYKRIPAYVIRSYRDGRFPVGYMGALVSCEGVQVLKCQVEDTSEASAHRCSIVIRCISYGIVTEGPTIIEFDRKDVELVARVFPPFFGEIPGYGQIPNLNNLREVDTVHRLKLLLIVLKSETELIKSLPERFQLFAASVRYWIAKARPAVTKIWLQALLLVHLKLLDEKEKNCEERDLHNRRSSVTFDIRCQHSYAQWQSVMMEALLLNQILIFPLPEPDIATLYSGITAQTIAQELTQGAEVDSFLELMEVYDQLYAAVTEGLGEKLL